MYGTVLPLVAATAGTLATAAYLDAKFHIRHDLSLSQVAGDSPATISHITSCVTRKRVTVFHILEDQSNARPDDIFLIFEGKEYSYAVFFNVVVRAGNWLLTLGIKKGEIVGLNGGNSPSYLILWYALEGVGAVPSFVNCNLTGKGLVHCIELCGCRILLCDSDNRANVAPCEEEMGKALGVQTIYYDAPFLDGLTDTTSLPEYRLSDRSIEDLASLLYTSGSTGLPKAVIMVQGRELAVGYSVARYLRLKPGDRMYTCMPLYHGAAHGLCVTPCINAGATIVLGRKFSHKNFWPEVRSSQANILQYVGELCRYLLNAPPSPLDRRHNVVMAWGNGMRPDVWAKFQERFGIPCINELYAATDGLGSSFNENRGDFTRNAIGKRGLIWRVFKSSKEVRVKIDVDTEDIVRNQNGFAVKCEVDEPGEVIHWLDPASPDAAFHGYWKNKGAGDKRKIKDVFKKGDLWFRSGDMMRQDKEGRLYFVDRLGDTFRWKSENVSTNEVSDVLGTHPHIAEANVYGVAVPNADGRCGMASIVMAEDITEGTFDFEGVANHVLTQLPGYAIPFFLRITPQLDYTGTLKMQKGRLKREAFDVDIVERTGDKVYWLAMEERRYVPFKKTDLEALKSGKVRL
ncbi:fatty acid transporter [Tothia fuscella]|uniref:Very long-chain fatty acid transport protein n=1 Tax=Tothia fuscella TaxID=1048955 RepID=A0A9P4NMP1_9PEZI|nr:fatty acid transporter [Tothia fuscella]